MLAESTVKSLTRGSGGKLNAKISKLTYLNGMVVALLDGNLLALLVVAVAVALLLVVGLALGLVLGVVHGLVVRLTLLRHRI